MHAGPEAAEVASCVQLALAALQRCSYTGQVNSWLGMVRGVELLKLLAANSAGTFPAGVVETARDLQVRGALGAGNGARPRGAQQVRPSAWHLQAHPH